MSEIYGTPQAAAPRREATAAHLQDWLVAGHLGVETPGDPATPPVSDTGKTLLKQNWNSDQPAAKYARLIEIMSRFQSVAALATWSRNWAHFSKLRTPRRPGRRVACTHCWTKHCATKSTPRQRTGTARLKGLMNVTSNFTTSSEGIQRDPTHQRAGQ